MLNQKEIIKLTETSLEAISGYKIQNDINDKNYTELLVKCILKNVEDLPVVLAKKLNIKNFTETHNHIDKLLYELKIVKDKALETELQIQIIYLVISLISKVQNGGDKGFLPTLAKEYSGLDCSLSVWCLKEKLKFFKLNNYQFDFGYPVGHAVGILTLADEQKYYVDCQNGFIELVEIEKVEEEDSPKTAYPIFKINSSKRLKTIEMEKNGWNRLRKEGSDYVPKYLGISKGGLLLTLSNMHMLVNPTTLTYYSNTAKEFRKNMSIPEFDIKTYNECKEIVTKCEKEKNDNLNIDKYLLDTLLDKYEGAKPYFKNWSEYYRPYNDFVELLANGKTIYETKFYKLEIDNHKSYLE